MNGVDVGSVPISGGFIRTGSNANTCPMIGNEPLNCSVQSGGWGFNGLIDELEFFDRALSQAEIQAIVDADRDGKCKPSGPTPTPTPTPGEGGNHPPAIPTITEPDTDGKILHPGNIHMETAPFSDPDLGDEHVCTDWEIWTVTPSERVWVTSCIGGVERVHTHIGDGQFENSHAGRVEFMYDTNYLLRVRHRDSSGDPATEWSLG